MASAAPTALSGSSSPPPNAVVSPNTSQVTALVQQTLEQRAHIPTRLTHETTQLLIQHQISNQQNPLPPCTTRDLPPFICDTPPSPISPAAPPLFPPQWSPLSPNQFSPLVLQFWCAYMQLSQECRLALTHLRNSQGSELRKVTVCVNQKRKELSLKELYAISEGLGLAVIGPLLDGGRTFTALTWPLFDPSQPKQTVTDCFTRLYGEAISSIQLTLQSVNLPEVKALFTKLLPALAVVVEQSPDALWAVPSTTPTEESFGEMANQIQKFLLFFTRYHPQLAFILEEKLSAHLFAPSSFFVAHISRKDKAMIEHLKRLLEVCNKLSHRIDLEGLKELYATLYEIQSASHQHYQYSTLLKSACELFLKPIDEQALHNYPSFQVGMWWMTGIENGLKILTSTLHQMCWSCLTPSIPKPLIKKTLKDIFSLFERLHQRSKDYTTGAQSTLDELSASPDWEQIASGCRYYSHNLSFDKRVPEFLEILLPKLTDYIDQLEQQTLSENRLSELLTKLIGVLWELQKQRIFILDDSPVTNASSQTTAFRQTILNPRLVRIKQDMETQYLFQQSASGAALDRLHTIFGRPIANAKTKQTGLEAEARRRAEATLMATCSHKPAASSSAPLSKKKKNHRKVSPPVPPIHQSSWDRFVSGPNEPVYVEENLVAGGVRSEEKWQAVTKHPRGGLIHRPLIPNLPPADHRLVKLAELVDLYPGSPPIESACLWGRLLEQNITSADRQPTFDTICEELNRVRQIFESLLHHVMMESKISLPMTHDLIPLALEIFHHPTVSLPIKRSLDAIWPVISLLNLSNIIIHYPFSCGSFSLPDSQCFYDHLMAMHKNPDLAKHDTLMSSCLSAVEILSQGILGHTPSSVAAAPVAMPTVTAQTSLFFDQTVVHAIDLSYEEAEVAPPSLDSIDSIDSINLATAALIECKDWVLVWQLSNPTGARGSALRYDLRNDALQNTLWLIDRLLEKLHHPGQAVDGFGALAILELIRRATKELCVSRLIHEPAYDVTGLHVIQSCRYTNSLRYLFNLISHHTAPPMPPPFLDQCHLPINYPFPYPHHRNRPPEIQTLITSMIESNSAGKEATMRALVDEAYKTLIYPGLHYLLLIARQFGSMRRD